MKIKTTLAVLGLLTTFATASVNLNLQFGTAYSSFNAPVPDGTLWILATSNDSTFAGGFGLNQALSTSGNADSAFSIGQTLQVGNVIGGDTIFAMGGFNGVTLGAGPGIFNDARVFELGVNSLDAGESFAFYWFPGSVFTGTGTELVGNEVGGVNSNVNDTAAGQGAMVVPADGAVVSLGAASTDIGGVVPIANFTAVRLIPEPSTLLLSAFGFVGLLRRKR